MTLLHVFMFVVFDGKAWLLVDVKSNKTEYLDVFTCMKSIKALLWYNRGVGKEC